MEISDQVVCCFCGEGLPWDESLSLAIDVGTDEELWQGFRCHYACFRKRLHRSIRLYFSMIYNEGDTHPGS